MRALLSLTAALGLFACGQGSSSQTTSASPVDSAVPVRARPEAFAGKRTSELALRPEVAAAVDALAQEKAFESMHVGAGGVKSQAYTKYEAIVERADEKETLALLEHESPVVRAYVGVHVASHVPSGIAALTPLASDGTTLETLRGCNGGGASVGGLVVEALCASPHPEAGASLLKIHTAGGFSAADALVCAAPHAPKLAASAAIDGLRRHPKPHEQDAYLRVLAIAPGEPADQCDLARTGALSDDASVRIAAAQALWRCDDPPSRTVLADLATGKNEVVARSARASTFLLAPEQQSALLADDDVRREVTSRLGKLVETAEGTSLWLPIVAKLAEAHPKVLASALHSAAVTKETTEVVLRIAAKTKPQTHFDRDPARAAVVHYLARAADPAGLSELRRSLEAEEAFEVADALRGLIALRDTASKPAVEKLTKHPYPDVAKVAREALAKL